jgi:hypothetical protein
MADQQTNQQKKRGFSSKFIAKFKIGAKAKRPKHERTGEYAQKGSYVRTKGRFLKGTNVDITIGKIRQRNADIAREAGISSQK